VISVMTSRRHVVPIPELRSFGFRPILMLGQLPASAPASPGTAGAPATAADPPPVVGISTKTVDIVSSRGASIGTEGEMDTITDMIEMVANTSSGQRPASSSGDGAASYCTSSSTVGTRKRRLLPPEIVFPGAYVVIRFRLPPEGYENNAAEEENNQEGGEPSGTSRTVEIRFDAASALAEWAEAHGPLVDVHYGVSNVPPGSDEASTASSSTVSSFTGIGVDGPEGSRGVTILKSIDAELWERGRGASGGPSKATAVGSKVPPNVRQATLNTAARPVPVKGLKKPSQALEASSSDATPKASGTSLVSTIHSAASASASASDFRYDWTYSSPYAGTLVYRNEPSGEKKSHGPTLLSGRNLWISTDCSRIDLSLLSDRSQPILYYDDVDLYEDDLHDNGVSHLNVKIRVMPKCLFVLYRLVVRVDYVTVRCRDVRVYHRFGTKEVFRDISWRECKWGSLIGAGLPDDVGQWRIEDAVDAAASGSIQALLGRLPMQTLPSDIPAHSKFELG